MNVDAIMIRLKTFSFDIHKHIFSVSSFISNFQGACKTSFWHFDKNHDRFSKFNLKQDESARRMNNDFNTKKASSSDSLNNDTMVSWVVENSWKLTMKIFSFLARQCFVSIAGLRDSPRHQRSVLYLPLLRTAAWNANDHQLPTPLQVQPDSWERSDSAARRSIGCCLAYREGRRCQFARWELIWYRHLVQGHAKPEVCA